MVLTTPKNPKYASSSPLMARKEIPVSAYTRRIKLLPFVANRTAAVAIP